MTIKISGENLPNFFLILNLVSNLDRTLKPLEKNGKSFWYISSTKRTLLDFVSYNSRITLYSATNSSRVSLNIVRPMINQKFYEFCILRRASKEELHLTIVLKVCKACGSFLYLKSSTECFFYLFIKTLFTVST